MNSCGRKLRITQRPPVERLLVLYLYYVLRSPETPSSDKMLIVAALSYLVLPKMCIRDSPLKGVYQMIKLIVICVGVIIIVST